MFETKLQVLATRLGWPAAAVQEIRSRQEAFTRDPKALSEEIAHAYNFDPGEDRQLAALFTDEPVDEDYGVSDPSFEVDTSGADTPITRNHEPIVEIIPDNLDINQYNLDRDAPTGFPPGKKPVSVGFHQSIQEEEAQEVRGHRDVEGLTLAELFYQTSDTTTLGPTLIALCAMVGRAHHDGCVIGNLCPENLVIGALGEVIVLDPSAAQSIGYLAPERIKKPNAKPQRSADVFALGCILFEGFAETPLFEEDDDEQTRASIIANTPAVADPPLSQMLQTLISRAIAPRPRSRPTALDLMASLQQALTPTDVITTSTMLIEAADQTRAQATELCATGHEKLAVLPPTANEAERLPGWRDIAQAESLHQQANALDEAALFELLTAAKSRPDDTAVQDALASQLQRRHQRLERAGRTEQGELDTLLNQIRDNDVLGTHKAYIKGKGRLSLVTEPKAKVDLYRYEERDRRYWPTPVGSLGETPIDGFRLAMDSYVCLIHQEDGPDVRYPVLIPRHTDWTGIPPQGERPACIQLPSKEDLGDDGCFVAAGWFRAGAESGDVLPKAQRWLDSFIIQRTPVTMKDYMSFLGALHITGQTTTLEQCILQTPERSTSFWPRLVNNRGRFELEEDDAGRTWSPDWPVVCVPYAGAVAYAKWLSARDDLPWSLPSELQWEKAARGVDGRHLPWGDHPEPLYARFAAAHPTKNDAFPADSSPYGVRGMAGNVADWVIGEHNPPGEGYQIARGGHFATGAGGLSLTQRLIQPDGGAPFIGFRLARPFPATQNS